MIPKKVTIINAGDGLRGIYFDGRLVAEGHNLSGLTLLECMEIPFVCDNDSFKFATKLPETLGETKRAAKKKTVSAKKLPKKSKRNK